MVALKMLISKSPASQMRTNGGILIMDQNKSSYLLTPIPSRSRAEKPEGTENLKYWQPGHQGLDFCLENLKPNKQKSPTNDQEIQTLKILESMIGDFKGSILFS